MTIKGKLIKATVVSLIVAAMSPCSVFAGSGSIPAQEGYVSEDPSPRPACSSHSNSDGGGRATLALDYDDVPLKRKAYERALADKIAADEALEAAIEDEAAQEAARKFAEDMEQALKNAERELNDALLAAGDIGVIIDSDYEYASEEDPGEREQLCKRQKNNPMTVKAASRSFKSKRLRKSAKKCSLIRVEKAAGKIRYAVKSRNTKKITVDRKTGKINIGKGIRKGCYLLKVKVTATGNEHYASAEKCVIVRIKIN